MRSWRAPLSSWESAWLIAIPVVGALLLLTVSLGMKTGPLVRVSADNMRAYTALPDLCAFPADQLPDPLLRPDPDSKELDRNSAACTFAREGGTTSVRIEAARPDASSYKTADERLAAALESFQRESSSVGGTFTPLTLGEQAKIAVHDQEKGADLLVRDGMLVVEVAVLIPGGSPDQARGAALGIATELLRTLPPDRR
ncbi:hypothetical protein ACFVMC_23750 [Nocardia sp. NPDC127579]|uniref:hypothetical protein n=1 Tax=Nocardia sp. NPDC127579 TaxID=3345402 RepID=UPI00362613C5